MRALGRTFSISVQYEFCLGVQWLNPRDEYVFFPTVFRNQLDEEEMEEHDAFRVPYNYGFLILRGSR